MPIYAYRCAACGAEKDVLQKFSDAPLTVCPSCGAESFQRVLTAPAFQLKGSGWYVTDFRDGNKAKPGSPPASDTASGGAANGAKTDDASAASKPTKPDGGSAKAGDSPATPAAGSAPGTGSA